MRIQNHLKTKEVSRQKVAGENSISKRGLKEKTRETKTCKKTWCQEKTGSRWGGENGKTSEEKEMPKDRDAYRRGVNRKQLKRHRCQETAMPSEQHCQERRVCQVPGPRLVNRKGCPDSEMTNAKPIKTK